jgi:CheY-like chemotaxis protein
MINVLYADDERGLLEVCKEFLELSGSINVDLASSAKEALRMMDVKHFDAVISDYKMRNIDGLEFLRQIRKNDKEIPFILFTGHGREEVARDAYKAGVTCYVHKAGDPTSMYIELEKRIIDAVDKREAQDALRTKNLQANLAMDLARIAPWEYDPWTKMFNFDDSLFCFLGMEGVRKGRYTMPKQEYISKFIHPDDRQKTRKWLNQQVIDPTGFRLLEHRVVRGNGEVRSVVAKAGAIMGENGRMIRTYGVIQDITDMPNAKDGSSATRTERRPHRKTMMQASITLLMLT